MKRLKEALNQGHIVLDLEATDMKSAIHKTVQHLVAEGLLPKQAEEQVFDTLLKREQEFPTAIGNATAIPHAYLDEIEEQIVLFVRLARPLNLGAPDGIPTQFLFFLLGPPGSAVNHLDTLAYVARLMSDDEFRYEAGKARTADDLLLVALGQFTERTSPEPEAEQKSSDGFVYTGKFCGGLRQDVAGRTTSPIFEMACTPSVSVRPCSCSSRV